MQREADCDPGGIVVGRDSLERSEARRVQVLLDWIAKNGNHPSRCKWEQGSLYTLKPTDLIRFPYYVRDAGYLLTHGFKKHGKWPPAEFDKAERYRQMHDKGKKR